MRSPIHQVSDMSSELLEMIDSLRGELFFYVEDGPLKNKLIERYMDQDDAHADILEFELISSVRVKRAAGLEAPAFDCRLEAADFQYQATLSVGDFDSEEVTELMDHLRPHCPIPLNKAASPGRNIIRKKQGSGLLNISAAAKALGLSHRSLKALIPCSEVRIAEEGGDKTIKEYYWEQELIGRFETLAAKQKRGRGYNSEDVTFIAESCCDGDRRWARDCISGFIKQRNLSGD